MNLSSEREQIVEQLSLNSSLSLYLVIGTAAGILAGIFGVGGGLVIVPALIFFCGYSQVSAAGTSLVALLLPVGLGGVVAFYRAGKITGFHVKAGLLISIGMFLGSFLGAKIALSMSETMLKRSFCIFILVVAVRLWLMTVD